MQQQKDHESESYNLKRLEAEENHCSQAENFSRKNDQFCRASARFSFKSCKDVHEFENWANLSIDNNNVDWFSVLDFDAEQPSNSNDSGSKSRGSWSNQIEFFLSSMAYAVGIGNVWRFPYICYKNGGGVFLIPYVIMLTLTALPLFYMELALGQFSQLGPTKVFGKLVPAFRGLGYGMLCVTMWVALYYNLLIAWSFFYTFASMTSEELPWSTCGNWHNTPNCFSPELALKCTVGSTFWNNTCVPVSDYCRIMGVNSVLNFTHCNINMPVASMHERKTPAEEYYRRNMLMMDDETTFDNLGQMNWKLCGCLFLSWIVVLLCLIKGVKSAGKVVWFTALFPYLVLILLFVRGITLPGAANGIEFFLYPVWSKLFNIHVWTDAATQIFYSLGPAFGGYITLASYNKKTNNCQRDAILIALINSGTSIFAGVVIFSILGYMAWEMKVPVSDVVDSGTGLAFVVYPTIVTKLPVSQLWSFLFFTMLLTLGLDSQFTMVETLITGLYDEKPNLRKKQWLVVGSVCLGGFILGLPMCLQGGFYIFVLLDRCTSSWTLLVLAVAEAVVISWIFGAQNLLEEIRLMGIKTQRWVEYYWEATWKISSPLLLSCIFVATLLDIKPISEGSYVFPTWANTIGWVIAASSLVAIIPFSAHEIVKVLKSGQPVSTLFYPRSLQRNAVINTPISPTGLNLVVNGNDK